MDKTDGGHRWHFFRAGGVDQVSIGRGEDLAALPDLDLKNWVALSCPVKGLDFDKRTLELLDGDQDGRIRAPEIQEAARWLSNVLKDPDVIFHGKTSLMPSWIDAENPTGAVVLATIKRLNLSLGLEEGAEFTLDMAVAAGDALAKAALNGDGVVPPQSIEDEKLRAVAQEILDCIQGVEDRCGEQGINAEGVDKFFEELAGFDAWHARGITDADVLLPLGDATAAASELVKELAPKIEDFFARGRLAAFDSRAAVIVNGSEDELREIAAQELTSSSESLAALPIAKVEVGRPMPLTIGINPAWADKVSSFRTTVVEPLIAKGKATLTPEEWVTIQDKLAAFDAWQAEKAGASVEGLGAGRVKELLQSDYQAQLQEWIAKDLAVAPEMEAVTDVERLVRYALHLPELLDNYVSFSRFYGGKEKAVFQTGTLYIDGRACDLCLSVEDAGKHGLMAGLSRMFLVYCDCTRPSGEKRTIVAAITGGNSDNLMVGRNAIFYDREGRDWDATVTKIIENPISLRQAFWSPYKKFLRMIEEFVAKRAAEADAKADAKITSAAAATVTADQASATPAEPKKIDVGTVAALGVAVGGITAALGALLGTFFGLGIWMPIGIVGLLLLISGPSVMIAWLKLRQRNIGPLMDASGWAINSLTKINTPFGASLTSVASIPKDADRSLTDPFRQKRSVWPWVIAVLLVLGLATWGLHKTGVLGKWLGYETVEDYSYEGELEEGCDYVPPEDSESEPEEPLVTD